MSRVTNNWSWEVKEVKGRRVLRHGDPYDAIVTIKMVNGICHVEEMMSKHDDIFRADTREIDAQVKAHGYNEYVYKRSVNGELVLRTRVIP